MELVDAGRCQLSYAVRGIGPDSVAWNGSQGLRLGEEFGVVTLLPGIRSGLRSVEISRALD
jgi:hypothetical protein